MKPNQTRTHPTIESAICASDAEEAAAVYANAVKASADASAYAADASAYAEYTSALVESANARYAASMAKYAYDVATARVEAANKAKVEAYGVADAAQRAMENAFVTHAAYIDALDEANYALMNAKAARLAYESRIKRDAHFASH